MIPTLTTERLILRAPRLADFDAYAAFGASQRSVIVGGPYTVSQSFQRFCGVAGHWALRGYGRWMVTDRETDAPLGVVGPYRPIEWPEPEIAWTLFEAAEGKGLAREAALCARDYVYRVLGWPTVVSCVEAINHRSVALAERLGCVRDGVFDHPDGFSLIVYRHPAPEAQR